MAAEGRPGGIQLTMQRAEPEAGPTTPTRGGIAALRSASRPELQAEALPRPLGAGLGIEFSPSRQGGLPQAEELDGILGSSILRKLQAEQDARAVAEAELLACRAELHDAAEATRAHAAANAAAAEYAAASEADAAARLAEAMERVESLEAQLTACGGREEASAAQAERLAGTGERRHAAARSAAGVPLPDCARRKPPLSGVRRSHDG